MTTRTAERRPALAPQRMVAHRAAAAEHRTPAPVPKKTTSKKTVALSLRGNGNWGARGLNPRLPSTFFYYMKNYFKSCFYENILCQSCGEHRNAPDRIPRSAYGCNRWFSAFGGGAPPDVLPHRKNPGGHQGGPERENTQGRLQRGSGGDTSFECRSAKSRLKTDGTMCTMD